MTPKTASCLAFFCCIVFMLLGCAFISDLGIQNDEALFGAGIYEPLGVESVLSAFKVKIPLMLMSYLGTLKAWIYTLIFKFWAPSPASVRFPALLAGAATIWLFFLLLRRAFCVRAALVGCALLATDPIFLLTTCFDWGPVALQHLLWTGGVLLLLRFHQSRSLPALAGGFLCFGLGIWDKALFVWMLTGLTAAALAVYYRELSSAFTLRRVSIAVLSFSLGALPFGIYSSKRFQAVRSNASFSAEDVRGKILLLRISLEGSSLFGWLVADDPGVYPLQPERPLDRASVWLSEASGQPRSSQMFHALVAALLLLPALWFTPARRPMLFALIAMGVAWIQMLFTKGAGGGVHHVVLLWPLPQFLVAIAFTEAMRRLRKGGLVLVAATVIVAGSNVLVTNHHYALMVQNGGGLNFTSAIYPLSESLKNTPASQVFVIDWGMFDTLRILQKGRLPLRTGMEPLAKDSLNEDDKISIRDWISSPDHIFIGHTEGNEFFPGSHSRLQAAAENAGYRKELIRVISDRNGRAIFQVFRFNESQRLQKTGPALVGPPRA